MPVVRHGKYEDGQALFTGSLFVGITMMMFNQAGLLTGSTAGLAFVLHYATGWSFGAIYFLINLPFCIVFFPLLSYLNNGLMGEGSFLPSPNLYIGEKHYI